MADLRIKISDGTTTLDLYSGTDAKLLPGGLSLPPPAVNPQWIHSPLRDGARLAASAYQHRTIGLAITIVGTSLADLATNVRTIQRVLNDSRQRVLAGGYEARYYVEIEWGDAGTGTFFDIFRGDLHLPDNWLDLPMRRGFQIPHATIVLDCKPFGRRANVDIAQATLENEQAGANLNYMEITTAEGHGDVPAGTYIKINPSGETGSKKLWVWKRSGATRYDDGLFTQGESETSTTKITGAMHAVTFSDESDAALSGSAYKRAKLEVGTPIDAAEEVSRFNYDLTTPPQGHFRVLAYCRATEVTDAGEYAKMAWGLGWSYGDRTKAPVRADGDYYVPTADNTWEILDLGEIRIPPVGHLSDIALINTLQLRIYQLVDADLTEAWTETDPDGFTDPDTAWDNEANAYDGSIATYAQVAGPVAADTYTSFLQLAKSGSVAECIGCRAYPGVSAGTLTIDVDAYYDAAWNDVFEGLVTSQAWKEMFFPDGHHTVDEWRIRLKSSAPSQSPAVFELDFYTRNTDYRWDMDYVVLVPVDEGLVIVDAMPAGDILALDTISDPPGVFIIDGSGNVEDIPTHTGAPFDLGREATRVYMLRDDAKGVTFAVDVKYQPRQLVI